MTRERYALQGEKSAARRRLLLHCVVTWNTHRRTPLRAPCTTMRLSALDGGAFDQFAKRPCVDLLSWSVHPVEPSAGKPGRRARAGMMTSVQTAIETTLPM